MAYFLKARKLVGKALGYLDFFPVQPAAFYKKKNYNYSEISLFSNCKVKIHLQN